MWGGKAVGLGAVAMDLLHHAGAQFTVMVTHGACGITVDFEQLGVAIKRQGQGGGRATGARRRAIGIRVGPRADDKPGVGTVFEPPPGLREQVIAFDDRINGRSKGAGAIHRARRCKIGHPDPWHEAKAMMRAARAVKAGGQPDIDTLGHINMAVRPVPHAQPPEGGGGVVRGDGPALACQRGPVTLKHSVTEASWPAPFHCG